MTEALIDLLFILIIVIAISIYFFHQKALQNKLFKLVSWCVINNQTYSEYIWHVNYISNCQVSSKINLEYCINESDYRIADIILKQYQSDLSNSFYRKQLKIDKRIASFTNEDYFWFTLCAFLIRNECESFFGQDCMYRLIEKKEYGSWGGQLYDAVYELTDFGRVFHKLMYIAQAHCEKNSKINIDNCYAASGYQKILDSNQIKISRV